MRIDRCGRIALLMLMICALLSVSVSSWAEGQTSEMNRISGSVSTSMTNEEMFEAYLHRQVSGQVLRGVSPGRLTGLSREIMENERLIASVQCTDGTSDSHDYGGELGEGITYLLAGDTITISGAGEWTESYAFGSNADIVHAVFENGVTEVGEGAFNWCTSLQTMEIPASLTHIRYYATEDCSALTEITYGGTKVQWAVITLDSGNDYLKNAVVHCTDGDYDWNNPPEIKPELTVSYEINGETIQPGSSFALGQTLMVNWEVSDLRQVEGGYNWNVGLSWDATLHEDNEVQYNKYDFEGTNYGSAQSGSISGSFTLTLHEGDRLAITKKLSNFGIPSEEIPVWEDDVFTLTGSTTEPIQADVELSQNAETLTVTANVTSNSTGYVYASFYYDVKDNEHYIGGGNAPGGSGTIECVIPMRVENHVICSIDINDYSRGLEYTKDYYIELEGFEPLPENACGLNLTWRFENETLILEGTGPMLNYSNSRNPWKEYNSQIKSIQLPEGITHIGSHAFEFTRITEINIPDSVESIGLYAFLRIDTLQSVFIPKNVRSLDDEPFYMCPNLKAFTVDPENPYFKSANGIVLTKDGKKLVMIPEGVDHLVIPEGVTEIGMGLLAFSESRSSAMTIPQSVKTIYKYLFSEDTAGVAALQDVYYLGSRKQLSELRLVTDWGEDEWGIPPLKSHITLHCAPTPAEKTLVLPSGTRIIEDQAFYGIKAEEVVIPSGARSIGSEAFAGNAELIIARIPASVTQIADNAFMGCSPYLLIIGESGSAAETYATNHSLSFEKTN